MGWTSPKTWLAAVLTVIDMNTEIRDNFLFLKENIALEASAELTIAAGVVTKTKSFHTIDTESDAASDDLDTINGGGEGEILIIKANHTDRTIVVKNNVGNIQIRAGADISLDSTEKALSLIYDGTNWLDL